MDIRTFAVAVQMEEVGHRISFDIERMANMAEFDSKLCFGDEEDAMRRFETAASKLREANKLFASGASDLMVGYSKLCTATSDDQKFLEEYARKFLN